MNAYEFAIANNITGTDAEIVAKLKTVTNGNIPTDKIQEWLFDKGLWFVGPGGVMQGLLQTVYAANETPLQVRQGLAEFYAAVWASGKKEIRTTDVTHASRIAQAIGLIAQQAPQVQSLAASFYALDGGLRWPNLTVEQFASDRIDYEAAEQKRQFVASYNEQFNELVSPKLTDGTPEEVIAGLRALADALES